MSLALEYPILNPSYRAQILVAAKYRTPEQDPRAAEFRKKANQMRIRDLGSKTMRWALHLSDLENAQLEAMNPDTLGRHDDEHLRSGYWADFISRPESAPFRVRPKV